MKIRSSDLRGQAHAGEAASHQRYTLAELLAVSDYAAQRTPEEQAAERDWIHTPASGGELL